MELEEPERGALEMANGGEDQARMARGLVLSDDTGELLGMGREMGEPNHVRKIIEVRPEPVKAVELDDVAHGGGGHNSTSETALRRAALASGESLAMTAS